MKKLSLSIMAIFFASIALVSCQGATTEKKTNDSMKTEEKMDDGKMKEEKMNDDKMGKDKMDTSKMMDEKKSKM